ncbi:uncharacterized protein LOC593663 isoform X2 [Strongylocentrotus purpuratus]|uniref:Major facilitator superfamily (MFS) profile domain-containing protein n=1 Tax=Strongylocentrotus purpuratus TaxID=7668 RepID=A0A7M7HPG8_STRPU|nr:uncharacterized protein LOC593663 isoform X2 [Strongylocentrotus purpuratus]
MAKPGARIILAARFTFFCMEIGLAKSFGVLVPELEEQLQTSNAIIGLITSLSLATMYLGSPIAKILIHQLPRPRMLTTLSGLAGGCALIATAFTRNLVFLGLLFMFVGGWVLFVVLYAVEHGIDIARGTYLTTSGAVGGIVSSILMSIGLRYRPEWSPLYLLWNQALQTVVFFLQILYSSYSYLMVMSFLIGFGLFGHNVTIEAVLSEVVQSKNFPDACSVFYLIVGIGYIGSGYIAGFVRDQTGNIELLFVFLGATSMASCGLILLIVILMRRKPNLRSLDSVQKEDQKSDEARRV